LAGLVPQPDAYPATLRGYVSAKSESPFAFSGRYPLKGDVTHHLAGRYPSVVAPTGSCAGPITLPGASRVAPPQGLCRWLSAPAGCRSFPTLSLCESFPECLAPYPGGFLGALARFFPQDIGLPHVRNGSAFPAIPCTWRLLCGTRFRGCRHFLMFRPSGLLATQVAPTAARQSPQGGHGFYFRAPHG